MTAKTLKHELQHILSGKNQVSHGEAIQAAANYLRESQETSPLVEGSKQKRAKETERLR
jgi:uncharacterized protein YoaH (UPF0181 family)